MAAPPRSPSVPAPELVLLISLLPLSQNCVSSGHSRSRDRAGVAAAMFDAGVGSREVVASVGRGDGSPVVMSALMPPLYSRGGGCSRVGGVDVVVASEVD